jgi:hypothetical protein
MGAAPRCQKNHGFRRNRPPVAPPVTQEDTVKTPRDRPPILRFLVLFLAGLAIATGLAALSPHPEASAEESPAVLGRPAG